MSEKVYEWGKDARLRVLRVYMGASQDSMADLLKMSRRSYQRWESGEDAIPSTVWSEISDLVDAFDDLVDDLVSRGPVAVLIDPGDEMVVAAVGVAMREEPGLEPRYCGAD